MFSKVFSTACVLVLALQVSGHAIVSPALGVTGTPVRSDVTRPSKQDPCGAGVNVASDLATATPVQATGGQFTVNVTNFNAGADGSQSVSATVDPTGTGASFPDTATIIKNGDAAPTTVSTEQVTASLPAGTTCTGGADGASCLVAFKTTAGFGNCVLVSTGGVGASAANSTADAAAAGTDAAAAAAAATTDAAAASATDAAAAPAATTATAASTGKGKGKGKGHNNAAAKNCATKDRRAIGSRAARPMRAVIEARRLEEGSLL